MNTRLAVILIPLALLAVLALSATALAAKKGHTASAYIDPFTSPSWSPSRTDMGVDWIAAKPTPVVAIGNAVILGSESHASWPGKHFIYYQLTDGSHAGDVVYVAEHLKKLLPAGTTVHAGQTIATALPGYPYTEWGWADQYGSPRAYPCYKEGRRTSSGKEMARFLIALGASVYDLPGPGSDAPTGKLC
jgi:hypothetical protein